ncbi:Sjoegren syndrome nuclear autoantigen 1 [Kryptolebias marmoratus]|uniref:Sjogren syndrome nuclear autoantigen 1 n=1 Tax=Kryptolebias marmoratus TaxID=37003 RepID=A0A3Q3AJU7_KRYMA|nr:Sjoegren syndrome nuclear autoantigen 1 [Kryptolebias marmoratus]
MTQQGAALQTYNNELVKCIEELCSKREELNRQIRQEEDEKERLQHDVRVLSEKLSRVNESLARRLAARSALDRTIAETEAAYTKILESSQSLLSVLKQEAGNLSKATEPRRKEH